MPPATSFNSVKIISLNREHLLARLREIAANIHREQDDVEEIRMFGSLARGDATGTSDADILIVLREATDTDPHRRILRFIRYFDLDRGTDLLIYTHAELEHEISSDNRFLQQVWRESIPIRVER
jgi:predicted nucleotidyltransferase